MSEQGDSEGGGPAKITADDEYKLEVNGFRCPDAFLTQFTPLEFEEVGIDQRLNYITFPHLFILIAGG
jgi:hypothetical protein